MSQTSYPSFRAALPVLSLLLLLAGCAGPIQADPVPVKVVENHGQYMLLRDGEPYYVKGVGGDADLAMLASIGGNSIRTWGDVTRAQLDKAHAHGLTVCVGLWIAHERHGFDYNNDAAVAAEIAKHQAAIDRLKDHPAVLMWGIGNEVELNYTNRRVWDVIEAVAAYAKEVDPHHPTMAVTAHLNPEATAQIKARAPSIDILGINSYKGIRVIPEAVREHWRGPYIITEWGPTGSWESDKTRWGAEIEATSTQKATDRALRHGVFAVDQQYCLGGYAFLWGHKVETTPTWFGMFTEDGAATEDIEVLSYMWSGSFPKDRAPRIAHLQLNTQTAHDNIELTSATEARAHFTLLSDPREIDRVYWKIRAESTDKRRGGDAEALPDKATTTFEKDGLTAVTFEVPTEPGAYRLYLACYGAKGKTVATANLPFYVKE